MADTGTGTGVDTTNEPKETVSAQNRILEMVVFLILGMLSAQSGNAILQIVAKDYIKTPARRILFFIGTFVFFTTVFSLLVWLSIHNAGGKPF
jgi:hypothetical protein